jgi:hypothetical protein
MPCEQPAELATLDRQHNHRRGWQGIGLLSRAPLASDPPALPNIIPPTVLVIRTLSLSLRYYPE